MTAQKVVSRNEWIEARKKLLLAEKELTHLSDAVAKQRQELPWVRIEKPYKFDTEDGSASLADLFRGRSQLLVYHFMFGPDYTAGCPHCSCIADGFNGCWVHLANHDVMLWAVSRAPFAKLQAFKERMGWSFPWASSAGSKFNYDFNVSVTEEQQRSGGIEYNYQKSGVNSSDHEIADSGASDFGNNLAATVGTDWNTYIRDMPGMSAFALQDGTVYHTYSAYARGLDACWTVYQWLDRAPLGRNETGAWMHRHDEYEMTPGEAGSCCGRS